jgi:hypothetical protein
MSIYKKMPRAFNDVYANTLLSGLKSVSDFDTIQNPKIGMRITKDNLMYIFNGVRWCDDDSEYIDLIDDKLTFNKSIDMNTLTISNISDPILATDVSNKSYVDTQINALVLSTHIFFLSGWKEYTSDTQTTETIYNPDLTAMGLNEMKNPDGEITELNLDNLGTYRITFSGQYNITTGDCKCFNIMTQIISDLNLNTFTQHGAEFGGITLSPGYYNNDGAITQTGQLILDAGDVPDSVFVIRSAGALAVAVNSTIVLQGGAQANNVYWLITGAIGIAANCLLIGNYMGTAAVSAGVGLTLEGRLFTTGGAIALADISVSAPTPTSLYIGNTGLSNYAFYTGTGAISTTGYTVLSENQLQVKTDLGIISGFGAGIDGTFPSYASPLIHSHICLCSGEVMVQPSAYNLFYDLIGDNFHISLGSTIIVTTELEKRISLHVRVKTVFGGISFVNRSFFAMPLIT